MKRFINFGSVEQLRSVVMKMQHQVHYTGQDENDEPMYNKSIKMPTIVSRGTEKIHGTNAAVCFSNPDGFWVQSRKNIITPEKDNAACAFNAMQNEVEWRYIMNELVKEHNINLDTHIISVFFEWAGGNIQKKSALTGLEKRAMIFQHFKVSPIEPEIASTLGWLSESGWQENFIFEDKDYKLVGSEADKFVVLNGDKKEIWENRSITVLSPDAVWKETSIPITFGDVNDAWVDNKEANIYNIMKFPTVEVEIDFEHPQMSQNKMLEMVDKIEESSTVGEAFGIKENIGEGFVFTFEYKGNIHRFKVKGEKHANSKVKTLKPVDEAKEQVKIDFANYACAAVRLEQAWQTTFGIENEKSKPTIGLTGTFLRAVITDVMKEEQDIMAEKGLEPKDVNGMISKVARQWFMEELDKEAGF